jgi:hypothetical protein
MNRVSERAAPAQISMSIAFPTPDHMPCPSCGASLRVADDFGAHVCDDERRLEFRLTGLRAEVERFPDELAAWLETPSGRFAQWLAQRERQT